MDLSALLSGATTALGGSGGLSSTLSTLGSASPLPFGGLIGSGLGAITSLFGNHPKPGHELPDQDTIAAAVGITREQAGWVCADEADRGSANFDDVCKKYAHDIDGFVARVPIYNSTHPQSIIKIPTSYYASQYTPGVQLGTKVPTAEDVIAGWYAQGVPLGTALTSSGSATQSLASNLTGQDIKNILTGAGNGAVAGAKDAALNTSEGKAATKSAILDYAKEYQLPIVAAVGGIIWLAVKAFNK